MSYSRIVGTGSYLPPRVMENDEFARRLETSDAWIRERTGIARRHVADHDGRDHLGTPYLHGPGVGIPEGGLEDVAGRLGWAVRCAADEDERGSAGHDGETRGGFHGAIQTRPGADVSGTFVLEDAA